jgi:hypothetical protein
MDLLKRVLFSTGTIVNRNVGLMKSVLSSLVIVAIAAGFTSCAQMEEMEKTKKTAAGMPRPGSRFDGVGTIAMYAGQPCTSQIMFDFQTVRSRSPVWLAARMRETKVLTDAANRGRRVHVWGTWQRGRDTDCNYVNVTRISL